MIPYTSRLLGVGGARTGIAPVNLLDVEDVNGNQYAWADRKITEVSGITGNLVNYLPWLLSAGPFTYHRSLVTDTGGFTVQNVSGNTLARDVETMLRATTLEGAVFVYRLWQPDAEEAWLYATGTLTFDDGTDDTATFKAKPFSNPAEEDTPLEQFCETCQLTWGLARCGSTQPNECLYSFQSCQVVERIMVALNNYETNYGETTSNVPLININRNRRV